MVAYETLGAAVASQNRVFCSRSSTGLVSREAAIDAGR